MSADIKKILIIKIGAIGDAVMALSMLKEIDKTYPGAKITWICGKIIAPLIKSFERINEVIVIDDAGLLKGNLLSRLDVISKIWLQLLGRRFDIVINAYRHKGYGLLALTAFKKEFRSFSSKNRLNEIVNGRYYAVEYTKLINGKDDWQQTEPVLPEIKLPQNIYIDNLIGNTGRPRFVITPGGAQNLINGGLQRRWSVEYYRSLTEKLITRYPGCSVILAGSKDDAPMYEYFKGLPVINLIGATSLLDIIYLYNQCDMLIAHDTGLFHLAKLSTIRALILFGPVNPLILTGKEKGIDWIWKGAELPCSPCYDGKSFADCTNNICMKNIPVEMVLEKITDYIR
ncbi:MAG: glycosyltransferase family 9 protein [Ignavibacteriaceae bacterium]|nr:glycosyltransferase family 9 protein [Ignavibacteriaceae bacterium]